MKFINTIIVNLIKKVIYKKNNIYKYENNA